MSFRKVNQYEEDINRQSEKWMLGLRRYVVETEDVDIVDARRNNTKPNVQSQKSEGPKAEQSSMNHH